MHNLSSSMCQTDLSGDSVYLLPLNHIYGLVPALLMPFITGCTRPSLSKHAYLPKKRRIFRLRVRGGCAMMKGKETIQIHKPARQRRNSP